MDAFGFHRGVALVTALVVSPVALAQSDFRRGDTNTDGVVDARDVFLPNFFPFDVPPPCRDAFDVNDDGQENITDPVYLLGYLFLGQPEPPPPGPHTPGPDPTEDSLDCVSYDPKPPPARGGFRFDLDVCPIEIVDAPDTPPQGEVAITLAIDEPSHPGAQGWALGVSVGGQLDLLDATIDGTAGKDLLSAGFEKTELIDPSIDGGGAPQGPGAVSTVVLSFTQPVTLRGEGEVAILRLRVGAPPGIFPAGSVAIVDGLRGSGQPVTNTVFLGLAGEPDSRRPELGGCDEVALIIVDPPFDTHIPGDCNQDGRLDISDAICVLGVLFLGVPERLPCGDGTAADSGNIELLDWHGDGRVDITDPIGTLRFLTLAGPAHHRVPPGANPFECVPIENACPRVEGCF